jgi:hypothetical protein
MLPWRDGHVLVGRKMESPQVFQAWKPSFVDGAGEKVFFRACGSE